MKRINYIWSIIALTIVRPPAAHAAGRETSALAKPQVVEAYGHLPLSFEANQGQTDRRVKFLSRGSGYSLFLTGDEAVLALKKSEGSIAGDRQLKPAVPSAEPPAVLRMRLVGANLHAKVSGLEELPGKSNYFIGNDPKKWRTNVPNYAKVKYANVYSGVDLVYYGSHGQLEYDFVLAPGADPRQIALDVEAGLVPAQGHPQGVPLRIDANGNLVVGTEGGEVIFHKPIIHQPGLPSAAGSSLVTLHSSLVEGRYRLEGESHIRFQVGPYDHSKPLVIDPTLAYSTYLGGSGVEGRAVIEYFAPFGGIAIDASGNAYVTGDTDSSDFPTTPGALQTTFGGFVDIFVTKLNAAGSAVLYSTYLGGSDLDYGAGIAVDASGNAYITGQTASLNFPTTPGAFRTAFGGGRDAFVSKLNAAGSALLYSTYLGGSDYDEGDGIAVDASGNAYVTGDTFSSDFSTTPGAFQTTFGGFVDIFVSKLNATGSALLYSTYLGGSSDDRGLGIALDPSGNGYVTGITASSNFPTTPGAFQTTSGGGWDAFVTKLNAAGSALLYSTYLGGSGNDYGFSIAIDASGNAYGTGLTGSGNFPITPGAFQTTCCGVFVTKLNAAGSALAYSTYLGDGDGSGIAVDASGNAYVTGDTGSSNFPTTPGAFQTSYGGSVDAFVSKLNAAGSALLYSTYLGGNDYDAGSGIAVDRSGNAYVTGTTGSPNFPTTPGAFQTTYGGNFDAFVSKFSFGMPFSSFSGKLELDLDAGSFELNAGFTLGAGGSINPPTQPVSLTIGTYSVTIPAGSFVRHIEGYAFEGVINGVSLELLIKFGSTPGSYRLLAEGRGGANLKGTTNPVTVTLSIGNDMGATQIHAEFE